MIILGNGVCYDDDFVFSKNAEEIITLPEQSSTISDPLSTYSAPSEGYIMSLAAKSYHT